VGWVGQDYRIGTARKMSVDIDPTSDLLLLIQLKLRIVQYRYGSLSPGLCFDRICILCICGVFLLTMATFSLYYILVVHSIRIASTALSH